MSVVADVSLRADQFPLGALLVREGVRVRLESIIPLARRSSRTSGSRAQTSTPSRPRSRSRPSCSPSPSSTTSATSLFRVTWSPDVDGIVDAIRETDSVVLGGRGHGDHWTFQLRFLSSEQLSSFYRRVVDEDVSVVLQSVYDPVEPGGPRGVRLSSEQRAALGIALESGYFDVPRRITLVELAEELGISTPRSPSACAGASARS